MVDFTEMSPLLRYDYSMILFLSKEVLVARSPWKKWVFVSFGVSLVHDTPFGKPAVPVFLFVLGLPDFWVVA